MDYSNSSCSRTRSGLVRLNSTMESNEVLVSKTRSGLVRVNNNLESNEVLLSKTRSGLVRGNINVGTSEDSCSRTRSGLVRRNDIVDSKEYLCSKTRSGLVRRNVIVDSEEGSCSKTRSGLVRRNGIVDLNEGSSFKTQSGLVKGEGAVDLNEGSSSKTRSGLVRGNTIVAASKNSCSRTQSRIVEGNTIVDSSEWSFSGTRGALVRGSVQIDSSEGSCSRTRSGLVRGSPKVQVKVESVMNGLSNSYLKEESLGKNEPNHKSYLVQSKDKPVMKGPDGWWKEDILAKKGSKYRSDLVQTRNALGTNGLCDGCSKENWDIGMTPNHKNDPVQSIPDGQRKEGEGKSGSNHKDDLDALLVNGLPDGWWKEDRPRKNGSNQKTDPYYIDPVSGYEFRSLKDVQRFLKSGDIYQCSMRPKKRTIQDLHIIENQSHTTTLQRARPGTADKAIQCELLTSEGVMVPWEEQIMGLNTENTIPEFTEMMATQRFANNVDCLEYKSVPPVSAQDASRGNKCVTRKRRRPNAVVKPKKHKLNPTKMVDMPLRASPRLASLKITHDLNTKPEDESISADLPNEVQRIKENAAGQSGLSQAVNPVQMETIQESPQTDIVNHMHVMQEDTTDQSEPSQADTMDQIQTNQQNAASQLQSSQADSFIQVQECITSHSQSQLGHASTVNQLQKNQENTIGQLQSWQAGTLNQIQRDHEDSVNQLQSSQEDSFLTHTVQEYITNHSQLQLSHANQMQANLGSTVDQLQSSQADAVIQMQTTQGYISDQSQARQADTVNHIHINQDNTANLLQLRQVDVANKIQTMQESTTNQPQFIQALTVNPIETNGENTANYLQPTYAENQILQIGFSLAPEPEDEAPVTGFWKNVENQGASISLQMDGKPVASSTLNLECQNVPAAAPAQAAPADPSGMAMSSLFGNSWSDPCIEFAFKTLTGDISALDDTSAVEDYFPHQQDLNEPAPPNFSDSPSCFTPSFDNTRNYRQADNLSLPVPKPSDKLGNGGWFAPK